MTLTTPAVPAAPTSTQRPLHGRDEYGQLPERPGGLFTQPSTPNPVLPFMTASAVEQLL